MTKTRTSKRQGDDGRRAELIHAASRVVAREGIAAATTRRIAEEAGVPAGLVHYWFSGKDELLEAVVAEALNSIQSAAANPSSTRAGEPITLFDRLRGAFEAVEKDEPGRQIALYELTTWALRRPDLREIARNQYTQYRQVATDTSNAWMREAGREFPGGTAVLAQFIAALFDGLALAWLADPEGTDVEAVLRLVSDLVESHAVASS